ncbi:hypothetical protein FKM82_022059 [Ascaphus truei]
MLQRRTRSVKYTTTELKKQITLMRSSRKSADDIYRHAHKMQLTSAPAAAHKQEANASHLLQVFPKTSEVQCKNSLKGNKPQQTIRTINVCPAKYKAPRVKTESLQGNYSGYRLQTDTIGFKNDSQGISKAADTNLCQHIYFNAQPESVWASRDKLATASAPQHGSESLEKMFLDFESVRIMKEDADEDSASDLSDSERIPIPPSPFTPPELNLRAEEIDPGCFNQNGDPEYKEYYYPDFLPPPFNSWNLHQLARFLNTEGKPAAPPPTASGFVERYVDRLLQLEWLQMQTVQTEKSKTVKTRPQTAPGISRYVKAQGKSKSWQSPLPYKQPTWPDNISKTLMGQENNHLGKYFHGEVTGQPYAHRSYTKVSDTMEGFSSGRKQAQDGRFVTKKRPMPSCQQIMNSPSFERNPKIQSISNIRPQQPPPIFHGSESTLKLLKSNTRMNVKKNGASVNNHVATKPCTGDRKLKASGVKSSSKMKPI